MKSFIKRNGIAYVLNLGEEWRAGSPPDDAVAVGMPDGRVWVVGENRYRNDYYYCRRRRRRGFNRLRKGKPLLNHYQRRAVERIMYGHGR